MCLRFRLLCIYGVLADFEQVIVPVSLFLALLLTRHWFVQCQQHLYITVILQYNSGSMTADFEQVTVSIHLFFTRMLCIYIILDKGSHILYIFCLNSTVCSHIVDAHLSIEQVTYDFMIDADLYIFLLRLRIKSFQQTSVCISLWYHILVQFGMSS